MVQGDLRRHGARRASVLIAICIVGTVLATVSAFAGTPAGVHGWQRADLTPVTQPVAIAGRFILYDGSSRRLHVVALDARTGKTAWSLLASISDVTPGVAPALDVSGSRVIALLSRSAEPGVAVVAAIDARSGMVIWTSGPGRFSSTPSPCPGEPTVVCVTGTLTRGQATGGLRFDLATGTTLAPVAPDAPGARDLGAGLLDPGLRKPDYLVAVHGSAIAWRVPLARIFGAGSTTDTGWNFDRFEKLGLIVGSVGYPPLKLTRTYGILDLSRQMTAGFRIGDGSVLWRNRGAILACGSLPCPGFGLEGYLEQAERATSRPAVGLRLRMTGTLKATFTEQFSASPDATVAIEGFDPATGRTLWHFNAGRSIGLISQSLHTAQTGPERIVLRDRRGGYLELDLRTGARHRVAPTARGWCRGAIFYRQAVPYLAAGGRKITQYVGQGSLFPCLATGKRLPTPARASTLVRDIGATTRGVAAWSDTTGVIAAPA
jgi:hypothetical protein